ncbi:HipA domain-containing protein [Arthrobacter sp. AQ5-05]|uniref:HipA domain-containing protein n=1 Tax=Arthrobacter sp. AQ5-05 TaxID=2184581 RepID=UPI0025700CF1|nr:HipA domain-containing protein [Arthrobacter sp. AQ5-05]
MLRKQDRPTNFFGGLLPEGRGRTNLAKQAGVDSTDTFGMLDYAGWDLPGAVNVGKDPGPRAEHIRARVSDVEQLLARTADHAMGTVGGGGSLPGVQPKATLALFDGQWHITKGGAVSTHIVKPVAAGEEWRAHWEAYCLSLGRELGLLEFEASVMRFESRTALVVERYDRIIRGAGDVERLHQEDSAQALGLPWDGDAKFEAVDHGAALKNIAGLLPAVRKLSPSRGDRHRLLAYTTFNAAIGNTDAHAKNFSIRHFRDGKVGLAPLYDVTALALAPDGQQDLALRVNGVSYQPAVTVGHLVNEGAAWGIPEPAARAQVVQTLEKLFDAFSTVDPLDAGDRIGRYISLQVRNLLEGKPAAVSSEPAHLARF